MLEAFFIVVALLLQIEFKQPEQPVSEVFSEYGFAADAILVIDEKKGEVIYDENSSEVFEIASITKVMTALVALEELTGKVVKINPEAYFSVGDTGLLINEAWLAEDLVSFMLVNSSNDAAEALASSYPRGREKFVEKMNDRARELGLALHFNNPTGLNETDEYGGRGNAKDIAELLTFSYNKFPSMFMGTTEGRFQISSFDKKHEAENTNLVANALSGLVASKTGYTDKSGGSLAIRFNVGLDHPVTAVILGTETREERFSDIFEVIKAATKKVSR